MHTCGLLLACGWSCRLCSRTSASRQMARLTILVCSFLGAQKAGISWGEARKRIYMVDSKG